MKESFQFPQILKEAIKGLDNESRWKILEYLIENGETSYTNLLNALKISNKGKLTFHLRRLSKSAILNRYEILGTETGEKSFYNISPFGKDVINGLMSAFEPPPTTTSVLDYLDSLKKIETLANEIKSQNGKNSQTYPNLQEISPVIASAT